MTRDFRIQNFSRSISLYRALVMAGRLTIPPGVGSLIYRDHNERTPADVLGRGNIMLVYMINFFIPTRYPFSEHFRRFVAYLQGQADDIAGQEDVALGIGAPYLPPPAGPDGDWSGGPLLHVALHYLYLQTAAQYLLDLYPGIDEIQTWQATYAPNLLIPSINTNMAFTHLILAMDNPENSLNYVHGLPLLPALAGPVAWIAAPEAAAGPAALMVLPDAPAAVVEPVVPPATPAAEAGSAALMALPDAPAAVVEPIVPPAAEAGPAALMALPDAPAAVVEPIVPPAAEAGPAALMALPDAVLEPAALPAAPAAGAEYELANQSASVTAGGDLSHSNWNM